MDRPRRRIGRCSRRSGFALALDSPIRPLHRVRLADGRWCVCSSLQSSIAPCCACGPTVRRRQVSASFPHHNRAPRTAPGRRHACRLRGLAAHKTYCGVPGDLRGMAENGRAMDSADDDFLNRIEREQADEQWRREVASRLDRYRGRRKKKCCRAELAVFQF